MVPAGGGRRHAGPHYRRLMPDPTPPRTEDPSDPRLPSALRDQIDGDLDPQFPDLDGLDLDAVDVPFPEARTLTVLRSRIRSCALDVGDAGVDAQDAHFVDVDLSGRPFESLTRVRFERCRLTGADFGESRLRDVVFSDCALDLASLRAATLERVAIAGGRVDEADLSGARLVDVTFSQVGLAEVTLAGARLERVDVTDAAIDAVRDLRELRGAIISASQAVALAPRLARVAGLDVASTT